MQHWDYTLQKNWKPETKDQWHWYLQRKINYDDWKGIRPWMLERYGKTLKLDEGKKLLIRAYLNKYAKKRSL